MRKYIIAALGAVAVAACGSKDNPAPSNPSAVQSGASSARPQYEPAFVRGTPGSTCTLRPEGNTDPAASLPASIDEDGVARFQVVRPTLPNAVDRLTLDCSDPEGNATAYAIDLRSDETFAPHPFDASRTNLEARPALLGDALSLTPQELIQGGYGLRPDPTTNPSGYARWLAAARLPAHKLRSAKRSLSQPRPSSKPAPSPPTASSPKPASSPQLAAPRTQAGGRAFTPDGVTQIDATGAYAAWTGAILSGEYAEKATSALSVTYAANEVTFTVPSVTPGAYGIGGTYTSMWNGLGEYSNQLFQSEVWANTNATFSTYQIANQCFPADGSQNPNAAHVAQGVTFTPNAGDNIYSELWYCDANGNLDMAGGYACWSMTDVTQSLVWDCNQANSTSCASWQLKAAGMVNGVIGTTAEFIIENDNSENDNYAQGPWPDFTAPLAMKGSALVVTGSTTQNGWVNVATDPAVRLLEDYTPATNLDHVNVSVQSPDTVNWSMSQYQGAVSTVSWAANRLDSFARGADGTLLHYWFDGTTWSGPQSLGGSITSAPTAVSWGPNRLDVFAQGSDGTFAHYWFDGTQWWEPQSLGGSITGNPAAVAWGPNRLDVFARATDGTLSHKYFDGTQWGGPEPLGAIPSDPVAVSWGPKRLDVFARNADGTLWHKYFDGTQWGGPDPLGGSMTGQPAVVSWGPKRLDVFGRGSDSTLRHQWFDGTQWGGPEPLGGSIASDPTVASWSFGRLDIFAHGTDTTVQHKWFSTTDGWGHWESLGGDGIGPLSVVSWGPSRLDIFEHRRDGAEGHEGFDGTSWGSWQSLGGNLQ